jgi:hypothetical protein
MALNYRVGTNRGGNMMDPQPQRMENADGTRSALGRTVKGENAQPGVYNPVQVWTLKERRREGQSFTDPTAPWRVVQRHASLEAAEEWTGQKWNPHKHSTRPKT